MEIPTMNWDTFDEWISKELALNPDRKFLRMVSTRCPIAGYFKFALEGLIDKDNVITVSPSMIEVYGRNADGSRNRVAMRALALSEITFVREFDHHGNIDLAYTRSNMLSVTVAE